MAALVPELIWQGPKLAAVAGIGCAGLLDPAGRAWARRSPATRCFCHPLGRAQSMARWPLRGDAASSAISAAAAVGSQPGVRGRLSCGSRFGTSHAASLRARHRSSVPLSLGSVRKRTPDLASAWASAHIAERAERHTQHHAPARSSASRTARCDRLHCPRRDVSSMVIDFRRQSPAEQAARV